MNILKVGTMCFLFSGKKKIFSSVFAGPVNVSYMHSEIKVSLYSNNPLVMYKDRFSSCHERGTKKKF